MYYMCLSSLELCSIDICQYLCTYSYYMCMYIHYTVGYVIEL